jgi:protein-export membrane protein SecD
LVNKLPEGGAPETQHMRGPHDAQSTIRFTPSPQPIPPTQPALKKRRRVWPWVVGGAGFLIVAIAVVSVVGFLRYLKKPLVHHLVLRLDDNAGSRDEMALTANIIKNRLNALGLRSFEVNPGTPGTGEILVNLPRMENPERVKQIITSPGKLEFTHVISPPNPQPVQTFPSKDAGEKSLIEHSDLPGYTLPYRDDGISEAQKWVLLEETPIIGEYDIRHASAIPSRGNPDNYEVQFSLRLLGAQRLATWTNTHINEYVAVVLNNEVKSIAYIQSQISDQGVISGRFTKQSAEDLALVLNATGRLPDHVTIVSEKIDN